MQQSDIKIEPVSTTRELKKAIVFLRSDGIVQINIKENVDELSLDDFIEIVEAIGIVGGGIKRPILSVANGYINVEKEARGFSAGEAGTIYTIADAFVLNSFALKLIGNFYLKIDKPIVPTKMFTNTDYAVQWLKTFL